MVLRYEHELFVLKNKIKMGKNKDWVKPRKKGTLVILGTNKHLNRKQEFVEIYSFDIFVLLFLQNN